MLMAKSCGRSLQDVWKIIQNSLLVSGGRVLSNSEENINYLAVHRRFFHQIILSALTKSRMEVLSGPWADLALMLRQTITHTDEGTAIFPLLWLFGLFLFLSVSALLLLLITYFCWKLRQIETELSTFPRDRSAIYAQVHESAYLRRRRRSGSDVHC